MSAVKRCGGPVGVEESQSATKKRCRLLAEGVEYPETFPSFVEGIQGDFQEVIQAGSVWIKRAFKFLSAPAPETTPGGQDDLSALVRDSSQQKKPRPVLTEREVAVKQNQIENALRIRCASKWTEKENKEAPLLVAPQVANPDESVKKSAGSKPIREGDQINLAILSTKPSLHSYSVNDDADILIIGSRRMLLCSILPPRGGCEEGKKVGVVKWSQPLEEIESCTIRQVTAEACCQLDCLTTTERTFSLRVPKSATCVKILQVIQENREGTVGGNSGSGSGAEGCAAVTHNLLQQTVVSAKPNMTPLKKTPAKLQQQQIRGTPAAKTLSPVPTPSEKYKHAIVLSAIKSPARPLSPVPAPTPSSGKRKMQSLVKSPLRSAGAEQTATTFSSFSSSSSSSSLASAGSEEGVANGTILLTPGTYTRVDICARQMKHGVGEMGVRGKLKQDGLGAERVDLIIDNAKRVLDGAVLALIPRTSEAPPCLVATPFTNVSKDEQKLPRQPSDTSRGVEEQATKKVAVEEARVNHAALPAHIAASIPPQPKPQPQPQPETADTVVVQPAGEDDLKKYVLMLRHGVPAPAVAAKMSLDGIRKEDQQRVLGGEAEAPAAAPAALPTAPPAPPAPPTTAGEPPAALKKYFLMAKHGVPVPAVVAKMQQEQVSKEDIQLFLQANGAPHVTAPPSAAPSEPTAPLAPAELPANLKKYAMMIKTGVPAPAVLAKMSLEGICKEDQQRVLGGNAPSAAPLPTVKAPQPPAGPKLLGLHWEPIKDNFDEATLWGQQTSHRALEENEFAKLTSLFARKEGAGTGASAAATPLQQQQQPATQEKAKQPQHIDSSRGMNLAIGLASFRSKNMGVDEIVAAVKILDAERLGGADGVMKIREMLPSETESKQLAKCKFESLHDAEKILFRLAEMGEVKARVGTMLFLSNAAASSQTLVQSLSCLRDVCGEARSSEGLITCLTSVLVIGNALNANTYKGSAKGFRISSLSKLHSTKSSDGTSLVDYLVQVLTGREGEGGEGGIAAAKALALPQSALGRALAAVKQLSLPDLLRDAQALEKEYRECERVVQAVLAEAESHTHAERLRNWQAQAKDRVDAAKSCAEEARAAGEQLAQFYGEAPDQASSLLTTLLEFVDVLGKAIEKSKAVERRRAASARAAAAKLSKAK